MSPALRLLGLFVIAGGGVASLSAASLVEAKHPPLSEDEVARLRAWIDAGLPWTETTSGSASASGAGL